MDATLIKALQLILSLSILVVLHEGGHFFFSKLFGVKVEKFFLFFDPYFHLFSTKDKWVTRLFPRLKKNETEYGVGWLPFGGYVKISGMIDESMDTEQMSKPVQSYEFRAKPAWQRLFIMIGGVLVNFLLALVIYSMVLFAWGEQYMPMKNMTMGFNFNFFGTPETCPAKVQSDLLGMLPSELIGMSFSRSYLMMPEYTALAMLLPR